MMRYTCMSCQQGRHDECDGRRLPPKGMLGGSECDCDGKCGERARGKPLMDEVAALAKFYFYEEKAK